MKLSVIVPTYNRKDLLVGCLNALFEQSCSKSDFEILVIDDGSTDGTREIVKEIMEQSAAILKYFGQENRGPAAARNVGIKKANGEILIFIGDDIVAAPSLIDMHLNWHEQYSDENVAILGYVTWSPQIKITPFMRWLENGGPQFAYYRFSHREKIDPNAFCTANISIKKQFLLSYGLFDEDFRYAAYEDTELGYRLSKQGLKLIFNAQAVAYHYHSMTIASYCHRMEQVGISSIILKHKHPELNFSKLHHTSHLKNVIKFCIYPLSKYILSLLDNLLPFTFPNLYNRLLDYYKIRGITKFKNINAILHQLEK